MRAFPLTGRRWVRWATVAFLITWPPVAGVLFVLRRPWEAPHRVNWWINDTIGPTVCLAIGSLLVGLLVSDVFSLAGREPVESKLDPPEVDYDDRLPADRDKMT
jgi:hypothetical protein